MDPYKVLGITPGATEEEIKKAYKQMSKKYHPDMHMNDPDKEMYEEKFKEVQQAYDMLTKKQSSPQDFWNTYTSGYGNTGTSQEDMYLNAARTYIQNGRFDEAMNVLNGISNKTAEWFFLRSNIYLRTGMDGAAIADARTAAAMEPGNMTYQQYLYSLEHQGDWYQAAGTNYGRRTMSVGPCASACISLSVCGCCSMTGMCHFMPFICCI